MIIEFFRKINNGRIQNAYRWCRYVLYKNILLSKPLKNGLNSDSSTGVKVIVSLTSFSSRLENLHLCIRSLLRQTYRPHKIILWLGSDVDVNDIPESLYKLEKYGLDIRFKLENLGSHKKYFYAMQEYPNDIVITVDDDYLYDKNLVKDLMNTHVKYRNSICVLIGWRMKWDVRSGDLLDRANWRYEKRVLKAPSKELYIRGPHTLYPPKSISKKAFDVDMINKLCTNTENGIIGYDDSWLKCMAVLNNTPMINTRKYSKFFEIPEILESQELSLGGVCLGDNYEGVVAKKIFTKFGLVDDDFRDNLRAI